MRPRQAGATEAPFSTQPEPERSGDQAISVSKVPSLVTHDIEEHSADSSFFGDAEQEAHSLAMALPNVPQNEARIKAPPPVFRQTAEFTSKSAEPPTALLPQGPGKGVPEDGLGPKIQLPLPASPSQPRRRPLPSPVSLPSPAESEEGRPMQSQDSGRAETLNPKPLWSCEATNPEARKPKP